MNVDLLFVGILKLLVAQTTRARLAETVGRIDAADFVCRFSDGAVSGATTQVSAQLVVDALRASRLIGLQVVSVMSFEKRHDEARGAIATLTSQLIDHRLLDRVQGSIGTKAFDGDHLTPLKCG